MTMTAAPGGTVVFAGPLARATGATGSNDTVTMVGGGTVVLPAQTTIYRAPRSSKTARSWPPEATTPCR